MNFYYRGILDKNHSWGIVATELCLALEKLGFNFRASDPINKASYDPAKIDPRFRDYLSADSSGSDFALSYCIPPNLKALPNVPKAHIYNYEFTIIPEGWAKLINESAQLFLPSSKFAKEIFIRNGVNPDIVEVLPHGIDVAKYNPQIPAVDLSTKKFVFLCVSSPHSRKGLDILLEAFGEEFATIEEVELVIKTSIPQRFSPFEVDIRKLLDTARNKLVLPKVRVITEYYPSLAPLYRAAHCYVSPNRGECFGLTELEAVSCGIPVITTGYGGYLDFLNNENSFLIKNSLVYAPKDMQYWCYNPKSLCAQPDKAHLRQLMRFVFNNYQTAQSKAKRAYEQIVPNYTWNKIAGKFVELAEKHKIITSTYRTVKIQAGEIKPAQPNKQEAADTLKAALVEAPPEKAALDFTSTTISSYSIIYNEEKHISQLLENIHGTFDEIVLVDGGSTDKTLTLINDFIKSRNATNIKLFNKPQTDTIRYSGKWNQAEQRNYALEQCTSDWIMMLDADDRLDENLKKELRVLVTSGRSSAFAFPKYHYWEKENQIRTDRWWYPNYSYRLWKNGLGIRYENKARHCQPIVSHLNYPEVLTVKEVKNEGVFVTSPIHHVHYLDHTKNELGLYRANDRDVKTLEELNRGCQTKFVPSLSQVLRLSKEPLTTGIKNALMFVENWKMYSGGRYYLYQLCFALARAGVNVYISTNMAPIYANDYPKLNNIIVLENWSLPDIKPDLVIGTPSKCGKKAIDFAKQNKIPSILTSFETPNYIQDYRGGKDSEDEYWVEYKEALKQATRILTLAELPTTYLTKWIDYPREQVDVMFPAVNEIALKQSNGDKKDNTIVFISRIVEHKNLDKVMEAVAALQKRVANPPILDIIGAGDTKALAELFKKTGVKGRFYTNISDMAKFQLIKGSRCLITCSTFEGFGISPIEALACNVPVVCYDLPIFRETLGDSALYAPVNDLETLVKNIEVALTKNDDVIERTACGQRMVLEKYSLTAMTNRWSKILNTLAPLRQATIEDGSPKFSVCIIALNEAEYIYYALKQVYNWDACHEIIIVEGAVDLYPKTNLGKNGLSGDGTTEIIKYFPDPQNKIKYVSGTFRNKVDQRNEYAKRVTGTHVLVLDADEFYTMADLEKIKQDAKDNPDVELFTFDFSSDPAQRTYFHLWYGFRDHIVGGYWNVPHNRIYKWTYGTRYIEDDHNHPARPDGVRLLARNVKSMPSRAKCVHVGFAKKVSNQRDKNNYYLARGEGKEANPSMRARRQMYINCRKAYETWKPGKKLPHGAVLYPVKISIPEALTNHPYLLNPTLLQKK